MSRMKAFSVHEDHKTDTAVAVALQFLRRNWLSEAPPPEHPNLALLLLHIYQQYRLGRLLAKKDAFRIIGAEHKTTAKQYIDRAEAIGAIKVQKSKADQRVELLVPTPAGLELIEREVARIVADLESAAARMRGEFAATQPRSATSPPPELSLATPFDKAGVAFEPRRIVQPYMPITKDPSLADLDATIKEHPQHLYALLQRALLLCDPKRIKHVDVDAALADCNRIIEQRFDFLGARKLRAALHAGAQRWAAAVEDYTVCLATARLKRELILEHLLGRADAYFELGEYEKARADLQSAERNATASELLQIANKRDRIRIAENAKPTGATSGEKAPRRRQPSSGKGKPK